MAIKKEGTGSTKKASTQTTSSTTTPTKTGSTKTTTSKTTTQTTAQPQVQAQAPAPSAEDYYAKYGTQMALVNSDPELKDLFQRAVAEGWTTDKFVTLFQNTNWYRGNGISWRGAQTAKMSDPGQWAVAMEDARVKIRSISNKIGFSLGDADVEKLAEQTLYSSWGKGVDEGVLRKQIVEMGKITGTGGEALNIIDQLRKSSYNNGQSFSDEWYANAATSVLSQDGDITTYQKLIRDTAKSQYPGLNAQLDAGMSVREAANGWISRMSQLLEVNDVDVDLNDPLLKRALTNIDANGQASVTPLWKFEQEVKKDERYFKTNTARRDMLDLSTEIARQFGKAV